MTPRRKKPKLATLYDSDCNPIFDIHPVEHPDLHEATALIAEAARYGVATEGTRVFLHSPPCPDCANVLHAAGVTTIYHGHDPKISTEARQAMLFYLLAREIDLIQMHEGDFQ